MKRAAIMALVLAAACDWSRPPRPSFDAGVECPTVIGTGSVAIDLDCKSSFCTVLATEENCAIDLTISGCTDAKINAAVDERGELSFMPSADLGACTAAEARADALISFRCETQDLACRADLYSAGINIEADVARVAIFDVLFREPGATASEPLDRTDVLRGYISDAAWIGDQIAVSGFGGEYRRAKCTDDEATLSFVDPTSMIVTRTTTAPPCLYRIAFDRRRNQLIGISGGETPEIDRFELDGTLTASRAIPLPLEPSAPYTVGLALDDMDRAHVTITADVEPRYAYTIALDLETFAVAQTSERIDAFIRMSALYSSEIYAADSEGATVQRVGANGALLPAISLGDTIGHSDDTGFIFEHEDTGRVLVASTGRRAAMWIVELNNSASVAIYFHAPAAPWAMAPWPKDRSLIAVGVTESVGELDARLALFDVTELHFRAKTLKLGRGLVSKILTDPQDRLWAVLPWSAELVRITVR